MYTTASLFFRVLAEAGITHVFVNWGSDHAAFLEDLQRQKAENKGKALVEIVTCPSEYVALSAAHGYALVAGKPAAVIVHTDVGTQALAGAIHNADRGHAPVIIFAGAAPFTANNELPGTKTEFPMWYQDVPDQPAIVRQYMRYTAEIRSAKNAAKVVLRALQIATSQPKGPVYLWAPREVIVEEVDEATMAAALSLNKWPSITMPALSSQAVEIVIRALAEAEFSLIVTGTSGRNSAAVLLLADLSTQLGIGILTVAGSAMCVPPSHPHYLGFTFAGNVPHIGDADVIVLLDCDVPWSDNEPKDSARIFVIDNDPLKRTYGWSHVDAELLCTADAQTALTQLLAALPRGNRDSGLSGAENLKLDSRKDRLDSLRSAYLSALAAAETRVAPDGHTPTAPLVLGMLRDVVRAQTASGGEKVVWLNESATNAGNVWNHIQPTTMFMSGGTSLGWCVGAGIGASLGVQAEGGGSYPECELVAAVSGDGNFLFGLPTAAYWIARRYGAPFLAVIFNNHGWSSPKMSMLGVHSDGLGSRVSGERLSVGFGVDGNVDFGGVAAAAGGAWARRVERADELRDAFEEAVRVVMHEKRCAVVECTLAPI